MSVQHANRGIVKKDLQLYYNREFAKSFRGEATINIAYITNNYLNSNGNWWVNSGTNIFNDNDTSIEKPVILNVETTDLRIFSSTVVTVGNQQLGSSIIPILPSTQYSMSIYYWFSGTSLAAQPYLRANINNDSLGNFAYNGDTNYLNWPRSKWIRLTVTFTTQANETGVYMSSYTGDNVGEKLAYFGYQLEQKAYATPLVLGSRSVSTTNLLTATYSSLPTNWVVDGSGQATIGTYSYIENNTAIRVVDVNSNTRFRPTEVYLSGFSASTTYTFSVKYRKVSGTPTLRFQIVWWNSSNALISYVFPTTPQINISDRDGWQLAWYTVTSPASTAKVLWYIQDGDDYTGYTHSYDLKEPQIQTGIYPTNWVATSWTANTIASNGGLKDISGNNVNADLTNVSFDSSGYIFAGSQYVNVSSLITGNQSFSWGAWIYPTATGTPVFFGNVSTGLAMVSYWDSANNKVRVGTYGADRLTSGTTILPSNWGYTFWTWDGATLTSYTNGIADGTATGFSFNISNLYTTIGNAVNAQYFTGRIAQTLVYNRALSAAEVLQNFNATRTTYGI